MAESTLNWKQVILTAGVTCVFTIIATLIVYFITTKTPALTYTISEGPVLPAQHEYKKIYLFEVRNTGRQEVKSILAQAKLKDGKIDEVGLETSPGITPHIRQEPSLYSVEIPVLNPKEEANLSLIITVPNPASKPTFSVRGTGVVGAIAEKKGEPASVIFGVIMGVIAAFMGIFASFSKFSQKFLGTDVIKVTSMLLKPPSEIIARKEIIAYILSRCGLNEESSLIRFSSTSITFMGVADFIHLEALKHGTKERKFYQKALKCLLLIKNISPTTREVILRAIKSIGNHENNGDKLKDIKNRALDLLWSPNQLREEIDRLIAEEEAA